MLFSSIRTAFFICLHLCLWHITISTQSSQDSLVNAALDVRNCRWGDPMTHTKPEGHIRLFVQNPNGIAAANNFSEFAFICQSLKARDVDIFGLSETGVDWKKYQAYNTCREITRRLWDHSRFVGSTSQVTAPKIYKPGGTCMVVTDKWTGRVCEMKSDTNLGRWSYTRITGRNNRKVLIMTVYQVCKNSIKRAGPRQAYTQQWAILRSKGDKTPDPRRQFIKDLEALLEPYATAGDEIILMGDFNEWLGIGQQNEMTALLDKFGLHDTISHYHDIQNEVATYKRGTKRIDYILATSHITESITKCGVLPFDELISSDHRGTFVDINIDAFLGGDPPTLMSPSLRGIHSQNPSQCKKYVDALHSQLQQHNVFAKVTNLIANTETHGLTENLKARWEVIDRDFTQACLNAERQSSRQDRPPWSPKLHKAHLAIMYWKITVSGLRTNRDVTAITDPLLPAMEWDSHPVERLLHVTAQLKLRESQKLLSEIRREASKHREDFLKDRATAEANQDNTTMEKMYRRILQAESTKEAHNILRNFLKPKQSGGLSAIDVQQQDGSRVTISEPIEMEARILRRNYDHYNQAEGTPFTTPPLKDMIGIAGETPLAQAILAGDIRPILAGALPETQTLLDNFQPSATPPPLIDTKVTVDDFKHFFKKWKEKTSTSEHRHLGHWKVLLSPSLLETEQGEKAEQIIEVIIAQMNLSLQHGYAWKRWRRIVTMMIEKAPGNCNLEKLRCIHLFEADFNWILGLIFGRRMIHHSEQHKTLHDNQWGSRPGRSATDAVLLKQLTYELSRTTRTPLGSFDNDAQACYDRIIMAMAFLLCQKHGVPPAPCLMAAACLLHSAYYVKTKYGVSNGFYQSTPDKPTHGPGQGSRMGPALWVLISCLIFAAMEQLCHGARFSNPTECLSHRRTGDGFVDDVQNVLNFPLSESLNRDISVTELSNKLQEESQTWERLLWSTGGNLELSKCFYYLMIWEFRPDGHPYLLQADKMGLDLIKLTSGDSTHPHTIEHKDCRDAHKTLGVWPTPIGNHKEQVLTSKAKSDKFARGVASHPLTRSQAKMAYSHMWLPSIGYPLPCTFMSLKQLEQVQRSAINAFLPKMGFARTTPRIVVFGTPTYGGMGLRHLHHEQGIQQTLLLVKHIRHNQSLGRFIRICLEWHQHFLGVSYFVLRSPQLPLPHAPIGWFSAIRAFLSLCDASIDIRLSRLPKPLRINDRNLMEDFISLRLSPNQIRLLNYCRLYLQVEFLSEVADFEGDSIHPAPWQGTCPPTPSTILWPKQGKPNKKVWQLWRQSLSRLYLQAPPAQARSDCTSLALRIPLGAWIGQRFVTRQWPAYQSTSGLTSLFIRRSDDSFDQFHVRLSTRRHWQVQHAPALPRLLHLPPNVRPCTPPTTLPNGRSCVTPSTSLVTPLPVPPTTFTEFTSQLPLWESILLEQTRPLLLPATLQLMFESGFPLTLYLVSDGGAKGDLGSFGWQLASATIVYWEGSGPTFGLLPGSFRAESYGMLSILCFLNRYLEYYHVTIPDQPDVQHKFYCDNEGLIKRINGALSRHWTSPNHCLSSEYDLEASILHHLNLLPFTFAFIHVYGHQDDDLAAPLSWESQLNVNCDKLATVFLLNQAIPSPRVPFNPATHLQVQLSGTTITRRLDYALREAQTSLALPAYMCNKFAWQATTFATIDWPAHGAALRSTYDSERVFIIKYLFRLLPIGRRRSRFDPNQPSGCPSCPCIVETCHHLYECPSRHAWRLKFTADLTLHLQKQHTAPHLKILLLRGLSRLTLRSDTLLSTLNANPSERSLITTQNTIGWSHVLRGRLSLQWSAQQQDHIEREHLDGRTYTGDRWAKALIRFLWGQLFQLWQSRNDDLHGKDPEADESHRRLMVHKYVTALYEHQLDLSLTDQEIFSIPLATRLTFHTEALEAWVSTMTPAILQALQDTDYYDDESWDSRLTAETAAMSD